MADDDEDMDAAIARMNAWVVAVTPTEYYRHFRGNAVRIAARARKLAHIQPLARHVLRETQLRMVRLRADFHAGRKPLD